MENCCRICGSEEGIKVNIFEPGTDRVKKIHKTLPIMVSLHDPFPKQICHHCSYKIDQFFEFRTTSIKTQERFRRNVPWLKNKPDLRKDENELPMVEVALNSFSAISPNEKLISPPSNGSAYEGSDNAIVIEDSPPYCEESDAGTSTLVKENGLNKQQNSTYSSKPKKPKSRSLWDTKKRKRKKCRTDGITAVIVNEQPYEDFNDIENDPLRLSPVHNIENSSFDNMVENNPCPTKSPKNDLGVVEKTVLIDDKGGVNISLPKYIIISKIPQVGNIYICEWCGRTFLSPQPASQHVCPGTQNMAVEENRPKEDPQQKVEEEPCLETDTGKDFYQCNECGHVFTRHSQLMSHKKKHSDQVVLESSSDDDSFKPFNKRKKHHTKRKRRLLNPTTNNLNSTHTTTNSLNSQHTTTNSLNSNGNCETDNLSSKFLFNFESVDIPRHSLLSSDSE